jgi:hypothetical protein
MLYAQGTGRRRTVILKGAQARGRGRLALEQLERRELLSAAALTEPIATPAGLFYPSQIQTAYNFSSLFANYNSSAGAGQTIGIVDAYSNRNIVSDLVTFDNQWGLPGTTTAGVNGMNGFLKVVNQNGGSSQPPSNSGWGLEEALDVEWAHAIAPAAKIVLVEANSASYSNLMTAVDQAVTQGAHVVSMSFGSGEFSSESQYNVHFNRTGVVFVASSGDSGAGAEFPAASPYVVGVGGTSLTAPGGSYQSEAGWSGSGGGLSAYISRPPYQGGLNAANAPAVPDSVLSAGGRLLPDVAYNADPNTGVYVFDRFWYQVGGTSAGAPQWAALIAIADQFRTTPLSSTGVLNALYSNPTIFHDVLTGSNGAYTAGAGFDLVTGLGSPIANQVVAVLQGASPSISMPHGGGTGGTGGGNVGGTRAILAVSSFAPDSTSLVASPALPLPVAPNGTTITIPSLPAAPVSALATPTAPAAFAVSSGRRDRLLAEQAALANPDDSEMPFNALPVPATLPALPLVPTAVPDEVPPPLTWPDYWGNHLPLEQDTQPAVTNPARVSDQVCTEEGAPSNQPAVAAAFAVLLGGYLGAQPSPSEERASRRQLRS